MKKSLTGKTSLSKSVNFDACRADYERHLRSVRGLSPRTIEAYGAVVLRLLDHYALEDRPLAELDLDALRAFLRESAPRLKASSQALWVSGLKNFLLWGERQKIFQPGLERQLSRPRVERRLVQVFDEEDLPLLEEVLKNSTEEERLCFELLYGSGLRLSEALGLCWSDVLLERNTILVRGKGRIERRVPLSPGGQRLLAHRLRLSDSIWGEKIPSPRAVRRWVERWGERAGLSGADGAANRLHPHKLRHSLATHLLRRGAALPHLQKLLGHEEMATTERYTHLDARDLMAAYDRSFPLQKGKKTPR